MIDYFNIVVSETGEGVTEPVTLDELKAWLQIDFADFDDLLDTMNTGSRETIEQELNIKLVPSEVSLNINTTCEDDMMYQFPWARNVSQVNDIEVSLVEDGEADAVQTLDDTYYFNGALRMTYSGRSKVAYTISPVVPTALKEAIKMLVAYRFENRGDQEKQQGLPEDIERKIAKFRQIWL